MDRSEFEVLWNFCASDRDRERLQAYQSAGSQRKAAAALGITRSALRQSIDRIQSRAARSGHSPEHDRRGLAPPGFTVKGKSTLHGADGSVKLQWVKTREDLARQHEILLEEMEEASERVRGLAPPARAPRTVDSDLLAVYPYGDPHIGMYAWGGPEGDAEADFDLKSAVDLMFEATQNLVGRAPPAERALICFLGDFYHADDQSNRTRRHHHQLDVDSRWAKVYRVGVETAVGLIQLALQKHRHVDVIVEIGNHDDHSAISLAVALDLFFHKQERVRIDRSAALHHYYVFGRNLIGTHHGHATGIQELPGVMAADRPEDWGRASHRFWYTGHKHKQDRWDLPGCEVELFRVLPPRDAYAQGAGYRSGRSMDCIVHHVDGGQDARQTVYAGRLLERAA